MGFLGYSSPPPKACPSDASDIASAKRRKLNLDRNFAEVYGVNGGKSERFVGRKQFSQEEESWERDLGELAAIIAEAKRLVTMLDRKDAASKSSEVVQEERGHGTGTIVEEDGGDEIHVRSRGASKALPSSSVGTRPHKKSEMYLHREKTESKCGQGHDEDGSMDWGLEYCENHHELINLQMEHEQHQRSKVMEALKLFETLYVELLNERQSELREGKIPKYTYAHVEAGERVKEMGMGIRAKKPFGHIPGIAIGDEFRFRAELSVVGLHCQLVSGIDYVDVGGTKYATSVVESGKYENEAKLSGVLIYSGQGGNPAFSGNAADQKLLRGNLALVGSMKMGYPVRVIYRRKPMAHDCKLMYVYDGLYSVHRYWQERNPQWGKLVYKFRLQRLSDQPRAHGASARSGKPIKRTAVCVLDDVSQGKEKFRVRAVNGEDEDLPPPFTYIAKIVYQDWYRLIEPTGCDCAGDCSDSQECPCVLKNGREIPFNEHGALLRVKPRVHECGPSCKCLPTCVNRVSQHGPRYQLEIFKTKSRGWGVRSRNFISSGSFICEYIGEVLRHREAEERTGDDEYLFDVCSSVHDGFTLDAARCGNVGRFINHSCCPNLVAQEVLYDNDDGRMPHIMFFAGKNIPPSQELTYDYNYKRRVCDAKGNFKTKVCLCGSGNCSGRM